MKKILDFIKVSTDEMKNKVSWPKYKSLQNSSILVLVATMIFALLIFVMDKSFEGMMNWYYDLVKTL